MKNKIKQWYWCGVFGELYGGANTTRFVNDVNEVMQWISDDTVIPKTVADSFFSPIRLLSLQTRQSAAYKGIMALILQSHIPDYHRKFQYHKCSADLQPGMEYEDCVNGRW